VPAVAKGAARKEDMNRTERPGLAPLSIALLIGAPLLMALGRLLLVPINDQGWDDVLTAAAAHQNRSDAGWILAMAASGLLGGSAFVLSSLLSRAGRTRAAAFTAVTTALGWAGSAGICAAGMLLSYQGKAPDRAVQIRLLRDANAGHTAFIFLLCVIAAVGYVVLAVGLARAGVVGKLGATLVGIGGVGTLMTMPGPVKALLVLAALVLLAGQVLVIRAVGVQEGVVQPEPTWEPVNA
jgi:hypothetical protein